MSENDTKKPRGGFSSMSPERRKEVASKAGKIAHDRGTARHFTSEEAKVAGKKGGLLISKDKEHMSKIGKLGAAKVKEKNEKRKKASTEEETAQTAEMIAKNIEPGYEVVIVGPSISIRKEETLEEEK